MFGLLKSKKNYKRVLFKIKGMHCISCAMKIDGDLEETKGVISASTSYAKSEVQVIFDSKTVGKESLINVIKNAGYEIEKNN